MVIDQNLVIAHPNSPEYITSVVTVRICIRDPNPGWEKIRIRDEHPGSYFRELRNNVLGLKILKFFDADPDPGFFRP